MILRLESVICMFDFLGPYFWSCDDMLLTFTKPFPFPFVRQLVILLTSLRLRLTVYSFPTRSCCFDTSRILDSSVSISAELCTLEPSIL